MLFKVIVCADDGDEVDYSIDLLRSDDAQSFIRGWQALQDAAQPLRAVDAATPCPYCKRVHDSSLACPEYAATTPRT